MKNHNRSKSLLAVGLSALLLAGCSNPPAPTSATSTPMADHSQMAGHSMKMGTKGVEALKSLKGKDFDIAFLSQMITHHQAAVEMAKQALSHNPKPPVKEAADKVIEAQTKEIAQMTGWLKEWHQAEPSLEQQNLVREDMKSMMAMPVDSDRVFLEMMIPHHQGAIDMSELVNARSDTAELKTMADKIIQDQKAEIDQYQQMLKTS